jgi:hypothetical protein
MSSNNRVGLLKSLRCTRAVPFQEADYQMLSFFKSQESKDFDKAMDFLECSRTLMSSAIETHRAIEEVNAHDVAEVLMVSGVVRHANAFLKNNLESINNKLEAWKLQMQLQAPERFNKIERIIRNAEKNMNTAREKAIHIDHWIRFDRAKNSLFG